MYGGPQGAQGPQGLAGTFGTAHITEVKGETATALPVRNGGR